MKIKPCSLCVNKRPNKTTLKAILAIEKGRDLVKARDIQDLFKKLRI